MRHALRWVAAIAVVVTAIGTALPLMSGTARAAQPTFNVRDFGAKGNGTSNDTPAINKAIAAANKAAGGGIVDFPAGSYLGGGSIHMMSNVTLDLEKGSTILGASSGYDAPEANSFSKYQDFGHSHFHDALIWGENLTNIGFTGSGTITGNGHFITGNPKSGQADKLISLVGIDGLTVSGITLKDGGHFGMLIDHCDHVTSDHLTISTASDRDGWNIIDTRDVTITNITIASNDDALVFKSDYALGKVFASGNVTVTNARLSARCCNALMFGSETCGNFTHYRFNNITITGAGKSGLGMVSEDGARISDVIYNHVTMSGTASPIMEKVGTRLRCGGSPTVGGISDIHYENVTGTSAGAFSPTLWGQPGHLISNVTFDNVNLTLPGGHGAMDPAAVPSDNGDYNPNSIGTRPAYGFYLHEVSGITFAGSSLRFSADDARPAFIANTGSDVSLSGLTVQAGSGSPFDIGFQGIAGYCASGARTTGGGTPRVSATAGSTRAAGCSAADRAAGSVAFYVSPSGNAGNPGTQAAPVQTVQQAQALVRRVNANMAGDVTVYLEDGFYRMTSPLRLNPEDSGTNGHNVVWAAAPGARPVLAGSVQITGWAPMSPGSAIWVAQAPKGLKTQQLYVNGTRAAIAHGPLPNALTGRDAAGYSGGGATMAGWRNPSGASPQLTFVYQGGLGAWTDPSCPVASFSGAAVVMAQPCWANSTTRAGSFPDGRAYNLVGRSSITEQPTSVQNAFQFLSAATPGEWFLDQGSSKIYYVPRSGEAMGTADVEAPVLQQLVTGTGTASAPVQHIIFSGIQFSYATWLGDTFQGQGSTDGFSEIQANYQVTGANGAASQGLCHVPPPSYTKGTCPYAAWTQIPGNVSFTYDRHIQFIRDAFVHLGAAGLTLGDGSQSDTVRGNVVTDTSGSGIQIGNVDMPQATGSAQTSGNVITDNHVFGTPAEFLGGIGIDSGYTASDSITHNQIDGTPYTAISQGWGGWPDKEKEAPQPNFSHGNLIAGNLIFNIMTMLNDGGGIYTQGITGTSLADGEHVTGNLIHDQVGSGHVIYTDNGCTFETISGNGIYDNPNAAAWASRHHDYAPGATTTDDPTTVTGNYWENGPADSTADGVTVSGNTAITGPGQIPASITAGAGLEPAYQSLLSWTQAPLPPVPPAGS